MVDDCVYTYLGGKVCGIYDPIQNSAYVETYSVWGTGKDAYNNNIANNGSWNWGVGNGFGY